MSKLIIQSKTPRFRRAGIEFTRAGVSVDADDLSKAQLAAIEAEPQLSVTPAAAGGDGAASAPADKPRRKSKKS